MVGSAARDRDRRDRPSEWQNFWAALSSNSNFEYIYWIQVGLGCCFDWTMRILGPVLLVFATVLIGAIVIMFTRYILPVVITGRVSLGVHSVWCIFVTFNIFWNYYMCAFTGPGNPDDIMSHAVSEAHEDLQDLEDGFGEDGGRQRRGLLRNPGVVLRPNHGVSDRDVRGVRTGDHGMQAGVCKKCRAIKPVRAHHCHVCDRCILNMDHHCPWMNNCVGYYNYRYFILFLGYVWIGCVYAMVMSLPQFISFSRHNAESIQRIRMEASERTAVVFTFVLTLSVGIAISILFFWHVYLTLTAQTTIEFQINQTRRIRAQQRGEIYRNPFDLGWRSNWAQVFGDGPLFLSVLPSWRKPPIPVIAFLEGASLLQHDVLGEVQAINTPHVV